ncbi:MAG TPA: hypothetical protein VGF04_03540 [Solirubrobacterales bacterium]
MPAVAIPLAGIVGSFASVSDQTLGYILCLYSGFFHCMGATGLLPEAHAHASWRKVGLTASVFALIFVIRAHIRHHPHRRRLTLDVPVVGHP